jgi:hypothetical protein
MLPAGEVRIYLACGVTDMRKGFHSLAAQVQTALNHVHHLDRRRPAVHTALSIPGCSKPWAAARRARSLLQCIDVSPVSRLELQPHVMSQHV